MKGATFSPTSNQYALPDDIKIMYTISAFNTACTFQLLEVTMTNLTTLEQDSQIPCWKFEALIAESTLLN